MLDKNNVSQNLLKNHLHTLELPWRDNKNNVSRIKPGEYSAVREYSKNLKEVLRLENKNGREDVLIHSGTSVRNTKGCPLVGKEAVGDRLEQPKEAREELMDAIDKVIQEDESNGEDTTIKVIIIDAFQEAKKDEKTNNTQQ